MYVYFRGGRYGGVAATDVVSSAFHKDEIGLDTDTGMKLNCDEAREE